MPVRAKSGYTEQELTMDYGLKPDELGSKKCKALRQDISSYIATATDPGLNLTRSGVYTSPQSSATMARTRKDFIKFFGFLFNLKHWGLHEMQLAAYSNTDLVTQFITYLSSRRVQVTELITQVTLAKRVNLYMSNVLGGVTVDGVPAASQFTHAASHLAKRQKELPAKRRREKGANVQ